MRATKTLYIDLHFEGGRYEIKLNAFTRTSRRRTYTVGGH